MTAYVLLVKSGLPAATIAISPTNYLGLNQQIMLKKKKKKLAVYGPGPRFYR